MRVFKVRLFNRIFHDFLSYFEYSVHIITVVKWCPVTISRFFAKSKSLHQYRGFSGSYWSGFIKFVPLNNRLGSRFWVNETSQISERYSDQIKATMKQKSWLMLGLMNFSMIEYPKDTLHSSFGHKRLCYKRATAGTFILNLLYCLIKNFIKR